MCVSQLFCVVCVAGDTHAHCVLLKSAILIFGFEHLTSAGVIQFDQKTRARGGEPSCLERPRSVTPRHQESFSALDGAQVSAGGNLSREFGNSHIRRWNVGHLF